VVISGSIESNTTDMVADFVAGDFAVTLTPQGGGANITSTASNYNTTTGAWSLTLASNALVDDKTYNVSVAVTGTRGRALNATANTSGSLLVDLSAATPTLTLLNDTGSSNSEGKTSDATLNVAGLEPKGSWEYTTDSGTTWHAGSGTQFTGAITDGASSVQVRQTDAAGNVSSNGTLSFTLDTSAAKPVINAIATNDIINASEVGSAITGIAEAGGRRTMYWCCLRCGLPAVGRVCASRPVSW
jgi:Bacterial Ig-like domain